MLKRRPPRRGQPLYKGQLARPQCVLRSEVLLYTDVYEVVNSNLVVAAVLNFENSDLECFV